MIYSIINNLLQYFTTLNFADRVAGICYPVELPVLSENNTTVIKRFPVIENQNKSQCDGNDYISLIPDDKLKSLIYHELISDRIDEDNDSYQQHTATVRLVAWFNLRNINAALTNCEQLLQLVNNKIPFQIADFGTAYRITCETTDKRIRDKSIFSQWSYEESEKQYLIYPFDFGHLTLQISYRLNKCAEDIVINPNSCNDLKAYPFATVYDKNQVIELHAGDTHTCEACTTVNVSNTDGSYNVDVNSDLVLPTINVTEFDSSVTVYPSVKDVACKIPINSKIYNSAGVLLYSVAPEGTVTITDTLIKDSAGTLLHTVKAQGPVTIIPDVIVRNSELTTIATIKAESAPTTITDITVTNPITGATYPYPAKKDLTESLSKQGKFTFPATYDDTQDYDITTVEAATYATNALDNVATVVYKVNTVVVTLPFSVVNGDTLNVTITRTNAALKSTIILTT